MVLASSSVRHGDAAPTRSFVFLHGILGRGQNLRALAQAVVAARPDLEVVLVDLRAHGASQETSGEDTLEAAARDVVELARGLAIPACAVLGHSFGGKVALMAATLEPTLEDCVVVDSSLNGGSASPHDLTKRVLEALDALDGRTFESRSAFQQALSGRRIAKSVAEWLAQSLVRDGAHYRFGLSMPRIHALLDSYFRADGWRLIQEVQGRVHLVIGGRSSAFDSEARERALSLVGPRLSVDILPTDHWVHVEDREGLVRVIVNRLAAPSVTS
jgi:esterase